MYGCMVMCNNVHVVMRIPTCMQVMYLFVFSFFVLTFSVLYSLSVDFLISYLLCLPIYLHRSKGNATRLSLIIFLYNHVSIVTMLDITGKPVYLPFD